MRDLLTRWGFVGAMAALGLAATWVANPVGQAEADVASRVGLLVTFTLPPGLALAAFSARFARRNRSLYAIAWIATCFFAMWFTGLAIVLSVLGELFYCEGGECNTRVTDRLGVAVATAAVLVACLVIERRLRSRWSSGPS